MLGSELDADTSRGGVQLRGERGDTDEGVGAVRGRQRRASLLAQLPAEPVARPLRRQRVQTAERVLQRFVLADESNRAPSCS